MKNLYKKLITAIFVMTIVLTGSQAVNAQTVQVTFKVDMSEVETISPLGVHIAGSFQGWDPSATEMTQPPFGTVYSYTAELEIGTMVEFKYVNGNAWGQDESVPVGCAQNNNRFLIVPDENLTLDIVCYESCIACNPPMVDITFQVDMSNQIVNPNGVYLAGSFQGWNTTATEMLLVGDDVYAVTVPIGEGEYVSYKFLNGNAWETVPDTCASGGNRFYTISTSETFPAVCFGSCDPCGGAIVNVEVTFTVDMSQQDISPEGIHLAGGFQGWDPATTIMSDAGDGIYTFTAILQSGSYQEYKFVNGNTFDDAEFVPEECNFNNNRYFTTPETDTTLGTVCFALCGPCPEPVDVNVTFQVDMSDQTVATESVYLIGSFNEFDPTVTLMELLEDGNYSATVVLTENDQHTYKFVNGNTLAGAETVPAECANVDGYREVIIPGEDLVLDNVCFADCGPCIPPPVVNVSFSVDMSNEDISPEGIHLAGSFQGWDPATNPMSGVGEGVYELTLELVAGEHHNYKFINGITFENEEGVPEECGEENLVGGYDRFLDVPETDLDLDLVCFGSCTECQTQIEVEVEFYVDMSLEVVSTDGVHLAGSFNEFSASATPMQDAGDNIYSATVTLIAGDHINYKFINGNTFDGEESVPAECGEDNGFGGFNRYYDVMEEANDISLVCFSSCEECMAAEVPVTFQVDMSNQVVSEDGVHLAGSFNDFTPANNPMTDLGDGIWEASLILMQADYHTYYFVNGLDQGETVPGECAQDDGFREILVPTDTLDLDAVCFGECGPCVPPPTANITFSVDMSNEDVSPDGVFIVGSFQNWTLDSTQMTLTIDNIYTYSTDLIIGETVEFKYINGISWDDAEQVPDECNTETFNRYLTIPEEAFVLDLVCFASCETCIEPLPVEITFQVDMSNEDVSPDGVFIVGTFQSWTIDSTQMTLSTNNIYTYTTTLIAGEETEYKFMNGISWDDAEQVPEECAQNSNRFLSIPETNTVLDLVCFGECSECIPQVEVNITFQVDMSNEVISDDGVFLAGSFQSWLAGDLQMTTTDGYTYSYTTTLIVGNLIEYKFINGASWDGGEIVPVECAMGDGDNRFFTVPETDLTLDLVCFSSCEACNTDQTITLFEGWNSLSSYRTPDDPDIENLMSQIADELVVLQTMTEVYFPAGGMNTIINWDSHSGYKIKVNEDVSLTISGIVEQNKTLQLSEGWNLIPVPNGEPTNVDTLFTPVIDNVVVIKGIAEVGVFWPYYQINTLINLMPGKAYFVKMNADAEITFP